MPRTFTADSKWIYLGAENRGREPVYSVSTSGGPVKKVIAEGFNGDLNVTADGRTLVFSRSSMTKPSEIYRANADGSSVTALTTTNDALLAPFNLKSAEEVTWTGGRSESRRMDRQAGKLQRAEKISAGGFDSWWAAGRME